MLEISLTELVLLCWAAFATAAWLSAKEDARVAKRMLAVFIEDAEAREEIVSKFEQFKKKIEEHKCKQMK